MNNLIKENTNILIVDDDSSVRYNLRKAFRNESFTVSFAIDGEEGYEKYRKLNPKIVITDWLMPKLNGIELIQKIRKDDSPQPVIIVLSAVDSVSAKAIALNSGADYYLAKPFNKKQFLELLKDKNNKLGNNKHSRKKVEQFNNNIMPLVGVGIAASTGGPPTVKYLLKHLGKIDEAAFFITQHGPAWMLESSVEFLSRETELEVALGTEGLPIKSGVIYIAPGEKHMTVGKDLKIHLLDSPPINFVKPSADPMFKSIAEVFGSKSIGVVLTGMGSDGSIGCGYIFAEGGKIVVEDPATAILHAMPNSVIKLKLADIVVPIEKMSDEIIKLVREVSKSE